jgi:hypothetical protein
LDETGNSAENISPKIVSPKTVQVDIMISGEGALMQQ